MLYQRADFAMVGVGPSSPEVAALPAPPVPIEVATDDWPFPYMQARGLPGFYLAALSVLAIYVAVLFAIVQFTSRGRGQGGGGGTRLATKLAFLLMGAAFLLLETKSIIQFSLLFGSTWQNNSLVFLAVLSLVLAANRVAQHFPRRSLLWVAFPALALSSIAMLVFPLAGLLEIESVGLRFLAASLLTFLPVFFANLLFSVALRGQAVAEHMFGWNLLGSTIGGILEYSSMAVGYNALTLIVAVAYAAAFVLLLQGGIASLEQGEAGEEQLGS